MDLEKIQKTPSLGILGFFKKALGTFLLRLQALTKCNGSENNCTMLALSTYLVLFGF